MHAIEGQAGPAWARPCRQTARRPTCCGHGCLILIVVQGKSRTRSVAFKKDHVLETYHSKTVGSQQGRTPRGSPGITWRSLGGSRDQARNPRGSSRDRSSGNLLGICSRIPWGPPGIPGESPGHPWRITKRSVGNPQGIAPMQEGKCMLYDSLHTCIDSLQFQTLWARDSDCDVYW